MKKKLIILSVVLLIFLSFTGCISKRVMDRRLNSLKRETDNVPVYVSYGDIYINGEKINCDEFIKERRGEVSEVFAVKDNRIWFLWSTYITVDKPYDTGIWSISSVALDGTDMEVHWSGEFCNSESADISYAINEYHWDENRFAVVNGYYYNGKIVLTDHDKLVEYNMTDGTAIEFKASEYEYPEVPLIADIQEHQKICFTKGTETRTIDLETAANNSKAFRKIKELEGKSDWENVPLLEYLFDSVQMINDDIYIICRIINYSGETHAVIFEYDFDSNTCKYAFNQYTNDIIRTYLYLVPVIE